MRSAEDWRGSGLGVGNKALGELELWLQSRFAIDSDDVELIRTYLKTRARRVEDTASFGAVYDLTQLCNLTCKHCCTNARLMPSSGNPLKFETTTDQVFTIIDKIRGFKVRKGIERAFVIYGGGEPTLRPDFEQIVAHTAERLGIEGSQVNTNGTNADLERMLALQKNLGFIEISIDGPHDYHNAWRNPRGKSIVVGSDAYNRAFALVVDLVKDPAVARKLEVSSAITKQNMDLLFEHMKNLKAHGVRRYSVHRAMPVGRMSQQLDLIPTNEDYLRFLLKVAKFSVDDPTFDLHLHHSLESIYSVLFLGYDIHRADNLLMGSGRHSIGIDWNGDVFFDPWCVVPPFNKFKVGNLLDPTTELDDLVDAEGSLIQTVDMFSRGNVRCRLCRMPCTGGMRFNAMGYYASRVIRSRPLTETDILTGLSEVDPGCPLFDQPLPPAA